MTVQTNGGDENKFLRSEIERLRRRLEQVEGQKGETGRERPGADSTQGSLVHDVAVEIAPIQEGDVTLLRLVQRIAMILQAEKIVIMFFDRESGELVGIPPAYGVDEDRMALFKVRATQGISGLVFREGEPQIFHNAAMDPRTKKDLVSLLHVENGITVPLVIERRDEENRVIERTKIGVLHAFNKGHGEDFNDEDVRLLERMARNVGSIIANQRLYKEVVEEREELLRTFESVTSGLILVSPERRISQINASARRIFGLNSDAIGKPYIESVSDETMLKFFEEGLAGNEPEALEFTARFAGLERVFQVQGAGVQNEEGSTLGYVVILNDITDQKNLDRMKSSFVAMASHELRTPLTAIKGFVSTLLMDDTFEPEERREFHQIIDHECDRLTRLINDLLNTARIEANESLRPNYTRVNLNVLLEKVVVIQKQTAPRHNVYLKVEADLPDIIGDEDKLDQVLTNLVSNAIKYSPDGGDVVVHAKVDGDDILIGVEDEGIGIPREHLGKIFDKFHRVHTDDNRIIYGTGLGLFLVKHLVEQVHLGKIWAESRVGKGSTFWFRVPVELDIERAKEPNR
ncbi:MAG: GAF domain-containing protein [Armatimonadetes bacterium]|nr:GAF domain-containing protein [Armatimonadota bacterium]